MRAEVREGFVAKESETVELLPTGRQLIAYTVGYYQAKGQPGTQ